MAALSENGNRSESPHLNNLEWLGKYYTAAKDIKYIFDDDFETVKKRLLDKNRKELENGADADWYAKYVVRNFVQSLSKSMQNLTELKFEIVKELKTRYPLLHIEWLPQESQTFEVTSPIKISCNGKEEKSVPQLDSQLDILNVSSIAKDDQERSNQIEGGQDSQNTTNNSDGNDIDLTHQNETHTKSNETTVDVRETDNPQPTISCSLINGDCNPKTFELEEHSKETNPVVLSHIAESKISQIETSRKSTDTEQTKSCDKDKLSEQNIDLPLQKCKAAVVVDDQVPGPSRLSHLSKRNLVKARKRVFEMVPPVDSSDSEYEPLAKVTRRSRPLPPPPPPPKKGKARPKSKQPSNIKRDTPSRLRQKKSTHDLKKSKVNSSEDEPEESTLDVSISSYWKTHDYRKDAKLSLKAFVLL